MQSILRFKQVRFVKQRLRIRIVLNDMKGSPVEKVHASYPYKKTAPEGTVFYGILTYLMTSPMVPGAMPAALDSSVSMCIASA